MSTDNSAYLTEATRRRSEHVRTRAIEAIRRLDRDGATINYVTVAAAGQVSRALLYRDPNLRGEIERLRASVTSPKPRRPAAERASTKSQIQLLDNARVEVAALRNENEQLRQRLAETLGQQRTQAHKTGTPRRTAVTD